MKSKALAMLFWLTIDNGQYGFRENVSTYQAIVDIVNSIQRNMDDKLFPCGISLTLKRLLILRIIQFSWVSYIITV